MPTARSLASTVRTPMARGARLLAAAAALAVVPAGEAAAQAANYPAFQPPMIVEREFNFGVGDGDYGTSVVFQWREGWSSVSQLSLDVGILDPDSDDADVQLLLGGGFARQLTRASQDMPLDMLFTAGAYLSVSDPVRFQIPVGLSVGHRFELDGQFAITPFVHPRVALEYCGDCGGESETDLGVMFDIGGDFEIGRNLSLRAGIVLGDDSREAIGISLAWRPAALRGR